MISFKTYEEKEKYEEAFGFVTFGVIIRYTEPNYSPDTPTPNFIHNILIV